MLLPVVLAMLAIASTASPLLAQAPAGSVTEIGGGAKIERSGRESEVTLGMEVRVHDRLRTVTQSHLTVTLRGGSRLMLAESSNMLIDQHVVDADARGNSTIGLLAGHLRSIVHMVAGASGTPPRFEVHTPNAVVAVRGTEFETAYIEGKPCPGFSTCLRYTDVGVYKGVVEVRSATNLKASLVRVSQGYETTVPCEIQPTSPAPLGMGERGAPGYR
jgi:ferric-dicitrate binding protein FerR (iron transport regulator)